MYGMVLNNMNRITHKNKIMKRKIEDLTMNELQTVYKMVFGINSFPLKTRMVEKLKSKDVFEVNDNKGIFRIIY